MKPDQLDRLASAYWSFWIGACLEAKHSSGPQPEIKYHFLAGFKAAVGAMYAGDLQPDPTDETGPAIAELMQRYAKGFET